MADEDKDSKTQDPTHKRLDDALERGDVAKSQEVNTWFVIAGATGGTAELKRRLGVGIEGPMRNLLMNAHQIRVDGPGLLTLTSRLGLLLIGVLGIPLLLLLIAGVVSNLIQHRLVWSTEPLTPKFSKISPIAGAARLFGKQAGANFLKGVFKVVLLGTVMVLVLWPERHRLDAMVRFDPVAILASTKTIAVHLMGTVVALLAVVAALDYLFQYRQWFERQKMSLQEVKEEYKQSEAAAAEQREDMRRRANMCNAPGGACGG